MTAAERLVPPRPRWVLPALAGAVLVVATLVVLLDNCWCGSAWVARLGLVGVVGLAWAVEVAGPRLPRPAFAAAVAGPVGALILAGNASVSPLFLLLMVAWTVYTGSHREGLLGLGLAVVAVLGYVGYDRPDRWLPWVFGAGGVWLLTRMVVVQQRLLAQLRAAQADLAADAAAAERRRLAGEIHDLAAHSLAVTLLHLTGVRLRAQRQGGDPELIAGLAEAERLGRQSLDEVRRTVGLLHDRGGSGTAPPPPGADEMPALVEQYRRAGLDVSLELRGDPGELPAGAGLALYRIAQEALANAVKHAAGASARVELEVGAGARLRVRNGPASGPGASASRSDGGTGLGLGGMRERAALLGGTLRAGPDGLGWLVECAIPADPGPRPERIAAARPPETRER